MRLTKLIYASNHGGLNSGVLEDILLSSRQNNARDGITGMLVVSNDNFMQILEGDRTAVAECFMRIMQDDRHQKILVMLSCEIASRQFPSWSMKCIKTSRLEQAIKLSYFFDGTFYPTRMSQKAIEGFLQTLAD
jgi:hypothetical protein